MSKRQYTVDLFHSEFVAADSRDVAHAVGLLAVDPFPPSRAVYAYRNPAPATTWGIKSFSAQRNGRISCEGFEYVDRFDKSSLDSVLDVAFKLSVVEKVMVEVVDVPLGNTGNSEVNYLLYVNASAVKK